MKSTRTLAVGVLASAFLIGIRPESQAAQNENPIVRIYLFISPGAPEVDVAAKQVAKYVRKEKGTELRTVVLVEDFRELASAIRKKDGAYFRAVRGIAGLTPSKQVKDPGKGLRTCTSRGIDLSLFDRDGLALAKKWDIKRLPAVVLVVGDKAHKAYGSRIDFSRLLRCTR